MNKKLRNLIIGICIVSTSLIGNIRNASATPIQTRIHGKNRYETAVKISQKGWETSKYVILVNGQGFADALSATTLTKKYDAPILLNECMSLNENTKNEIKRLKATNVIIIGEKGSISSYVEQQLKVLGVKTRRIGGKDRFETSLKIADDIGWERGVVITNGYGYADALAIAPIASNKQMPILLTPPKDLPSEMKDYVSNVNRSYVLGGTAVVSNKIQNQLKNSIRLYGDNRFGTNSRILNEFKDDLNLNNVYFTYGLNFPDALSVSALASKTKSPVVLVSNVLSTELSDFIKQSSNSIKNLYAIGGPTIVKDSIIRPIVDNETPITFKDKNFEKVVRDTINNTEGYLYKNDLSSITSLNLSKFTINNIQGIENLINLKKLYLKPNQLNDSSIKYIKDVLPKCSIEYISNTKKTLYTTIYNTIANAESKVNVAQYTKNFETMYTTVFKVINDHPELYYIDFNNTTYSSSGLINFAYVKNRSEVLKMKSDLNKKADSIIKSCITDDMSDFQKEKALHDYLVLNNKYDESAYVKIVNESVIAVPWESFHAFGALLKGTSVCQGYAEAMKLLCNKANLECYTVTGYAQDRNTSVLHAWNIIKINGKYYHVDTTWDDPIPDKQGYIRYDYFNLSDRQISKDHSKWDCNIKCSDESFKYINGR